MDILFKNDDFVFSYRVGGILIHNEKILLQRPKNDDYAIIGGHVAAMETSMETLKREFEEELHAEIVSLEELVIPLSVTFIDSKALDGTGFLENRKEEFVSVGGI